MTVTFLTPPGRLTDTLTPIVFTATEGVLAVSAEFRYEDGNGLWETIYQDGRFSYAYSRSTIDGGTWTVRRSTPWPADLRVLVDEAVSGSGGPNPPSLPPPPIGAASSIGAIGAYATETHTHAHGDQAGGTLHDLAVAGGAAGFLSAADKTKLDAYPATPPAPTPPTPLSDATPQALGAATPGDDLEAARGDHAHPHGAQAGGSLHALAVAGGAAGFISGADKTKLDAYPATPPAAGNVSGPATATDDALVRWDGTTGKLLSSSPATLTDAGALSVANLLVSGNIAVNGTVDGIDISSVISQLITPQYITLADAPALANERTLAVAAGVTKTDSGSVVTIGLQPSAVLATTSAAGFLSSADKTKLDAYPPTPSAGGPAAPSAAPPAIGSASAIGTPGTYATEQHTHGHGAQAGGTLHALAIAGGAAGFISGADKTKLDSLGPVDVSGKADKLILIKTIPDPAYTLTAADLTSLLRFTYSAGNPVLTIPNDATLLLGDGFNFLVLYDVTTSTFLDVQGGSGVGFVDGDFVVNAKDTVGVMKVGANRWLAVGETYLE